MSRDDHNRLARWAAACAESVIGYFEMRSMDARPREALTVARLWANGEVKTGAAMKASVAAHAAARSITDAAAIAGHGPPRMPWPLPMRPITAWVH